MPTPPQPIPAVFTADQIAAFTNDGYIAVERVLTDTQIDAARAALSDLVAEHAARTEAERSTKRLMVQFEPGADLNAGLEGSVALELLVRKYMGFVDEKVALGSLAGPGSAVHTLVSQLIGRKPVLFQDMALVKPPFVGSEKPWHQDNAYFALKPLDAVCGVWIALDDAAVENGCMHVIPGGHLMGALRHEHTTDCEIVADPMSGSHVRAVPVPAGGALFFGGMLPHQTPPNTSPHRRRALQFHYRSANSKTLTPEEYNQVFAEADGTPASCYAATLRGI